MECDQIASYSGFRLILFFSSAYIIYGQRYLSSLFWAEAVICGDLAINDNLRIVNLFFYLSIFIGYETGALRMLLDADFVDHHHRLEQQRCLLQNPQRTRLFLL